MNTAYAAMYRRYLLEGFYPQNETRMNDLSAHLTYLQGLFRLSDDACRAIRRTVKAQTPR